MGTKKIEMLIPADIITNKIYFVRGRKVMLDRDLAELYGVTTGRLNEQVKRNPKRFPEDFMFKITKNEQDQLIAICDKLSPMKHAPQLPKVFTELGISMLSSVLNSERAILINIEIMRTFVKLRETIGEQKEIMKRLNGQEVQLLKHDRQITKIFVVLDNMNYCPEPVKKRKIGFLPPEEK